MAAGQFSTSEPKKQSRQRKSFTLEQANRALPLVSRIVRDIVNAHERATQLRAKMDATSARNRVALQQQLDVAIADLEDYADELAEISVELKDCEMGLVDFPGRHQGREVYLCWKLGEERVSHWHELHAGFAGRQSTSSLIES